MPRTDARIAMIMAGGSGRRFWPLSRDRRPKHLVPLFSGKSLLALTIERLLPLFDPSSIWVITRGDQARAAARVASVYGRVRVLSEPAGRSTAPCVALGAAAASARGDPCLVFLPADHLIADQRGFRAVLEAGLEFAEREDALVTLGIKPAVPATGFGYIKKGRLVRRSGAAAVHEVRRFTEKPSVVRARRYVRDGDLWNSGIFICRSSVVLREIAEHLPAVGRCVAVPGRRPGTRRWLEGIGRRYRRLRSVSLDVGVMERTARAFVIPADIGWDDLGNWESFSRHMPADGLGNRVLGKHVGLRSRRCVVYSPDRLVATLGLEDLVVVVSPDAVLVLRRDDAELVKDLTALLGRRGLGKYL